MGTRLSFRRVMAAAALAAGFLACLILVLTGPPIRAQTPAEDQGVLAGFISRLLSTPTSRVVIGQIEGALSSDATIRDVTVADEDGVYLSIDRIRLIWRRTALLQRRIEVERLEIGRVVLSRRPAADPDAPEPGPLLPELPLALRIDAFALAELQLGEPVAGVPARLAATGSASLGPPAEGLAAALSIRRLDAAGTASLDLAFVPQDERLRLRLQLDEPAGGLLVRFAGVPGEPAARLDLAGDGTLDDWTARLAFEGGPDLGATGAARIERRDGGRLLQVDVAARLSPLLPPLVGPVFGGTTQLTGAVRFADDGRIDLDGLRIAAARAELTVDGAVTAEQVVNLRAQARALPSSPNAPPAAIALDRLVFDATVQGPLAAPRVQGELDVAGLSTPEAALDSLTGRLVLQPTGAGRLAMEADAQARGLRPADPALDAALGREVTLRLRGAIDRRRVATLDEARLASPTVALTYTGRVGRSVLDGRLAASFGRLDAFTQLAGLQLDGRARLEATLSGQPARGRLRADLTGRAEDLSLGEARLNRLLGPTPTLAGTVRRDGSRFGFEALRVTARRLDAEVNGEAAPERLAISANARLGDLSALDARLSGAATLGARLGGPAADPDVSLSLMAPDAAALGRPVRGLSVDATIRRLLTTADATLSGQGTIGDKPLAIDLAGRAMTAGPQAAGGRGWQLDRLGASIGSVVIEGAGRIDPAGFADGAITLRADDLDDASPLLLTRLGGRLDARIGARATPVDGRMAQALTVRAEGNALRADEIRIGALTADLGVDDLLVRPVARGEARARDLLAAGQRFETMALTARDGGADETDLTLRALGGGFDLVADARIVPGPPLMARLDSFRATRNGRAIRLVAPATLTVGDGGVVAEAVTLDVAGGRLSLAGRLGETLDLTAEATAIPLAAADVFAPGLGLTGVAEGQARITGSAGAPEGPVRLTLRNVGLPALRAAGVPPLAIDASGRLAEGRIAVDATARGGRAVDLAIGGTAALAADGRLALTVRGAVDAALLNARLGGAGQRVGGRIVLDIAVDGTRRSPRLAGSATLAGGSFTDAANGIRLTGIEGRAIGRGEDVAIERLTARTPDGGTLSLTGRVAVDPARSFPAELRIAARRARLVDGPIARLVADLDLSVSGPLATAPRIGGRVGVISLDVRVPERLGGAAAPLRDARHIAPPPQTRARLAQVARAEAGRRRGGAPFRAVLDVAVDAPARVFVRGRGLDAELGGSVRIAGTTLAPTVQGAFDLRRGRLSILTQRLDFTRGRMTFAGEGLLPELDFLAETRAGDVTARVAVSGPADAPRFAFSSSPALPEDEVLARLLFQRAAGGLSPLQALQLAQAAAQLSGTGGPDVFEATRRALGVDDLDVNLTEGDPTLGLSRAIGDRARLNLRTGARPESTGVGIDIDLTRRLRLQSEIGADGRASVGIGIEQEY